jgi:hypothetical protein
VAIFFMEEGAVFFVSFEDHFGRGAFDMEELCDLGQGEPLFKNHFGELEALLG